MQTIGRPAAETITLLVSGLRPGEGRRVDCRNPDAPPLDVRRRSERIFSLAHNRPDGKANQELVIYCWRPPEVYSPVLLVIPDALGIPRRHVAMGIVEGPDEHAVWRDAGLASMIVHYADRWMPLLRRQQHQWFEGKEPRG